MTSHSLLPADTKPWLWLLSIFTIMLVLHGINESDTGDFLVISQNTTQLLAPPLRQFLYSSPLNFMLADFLGIPNLFGFYFIHMTEIILMLGTILVCLRKKFPEAAEQTKFIIFLSFTPIWLVTLKWIGKPDPILISMMFLCWAYPNNWRWLFVTVMVMAHREMGTFMAAFLFLAEEGWDYRLMAPILIADGFHYTYENHILAQRPVSRIDDFSKNLLLHPLQFMRMPAVYLLCAFSWYGLILLWQKPGVRLFLTTGAALGVAIACEDYTRDFILMALPSILLILEKVVKTPTSDPLVRFMPLCFLQLQIAANGEFFYPDNKYLEWLVAKIANAMT